MFRVFLSFMFLSCVFAIYAYNNINILFFCIFFFCIFFFVSFFFNVWINRYEGTGRSLSLKLVKDLRQQSNNVVNSNVKSSTGGRTLREITLEEPIRYSSGDLIEKWLNDLLCLNCTNQVPKYDCIYLIWFE